MLCDYGCGENGIILFKNGKWCCSNRSDQCPSIIEKRIKSRRLNGPWHSDDTKRNISKSLVGRILTKEWKIKIGESGKGRIIDSNGKENIRLSKMGDKNPMFGKDSWNAGRTADSDSRILNYSLKQKNVPCPARSHPNRNKGKKKQESLEIILRDDTVYSDFRKYRNRIAVRTQKTYKLFKHEINPHNYPLGKCGVADAYQIDHIITVRLGFEQGLLIEDMSSKENLRVIPWLENVKKYDGKGLRK